MSTAKVGETFDLLRLPRPGNVSQSLTNLSQKQLVVRPPSGKAWSITPEGYEAVRALVGTVDFPAVEGDMLAAGGAEFSQVTHPVIPPELAPFRWAGAISRLLNEFPFETNVFCMTRFPKEEAELAYPDPIKQVIETTRGVLKQHGLHLHLASDRTSDDELFGNIAGHMWACKYGSGCSRPDLVQSSMTTFR